MLNSRLVAALSLGLIAAACAGPYDRQAPVPSPYNTSRAPTLSERNCIDYGFTAGTSAFDRCVQQEARSRQAGRVNRDYAEARLVEDARAACYDYGLTRSTQRYDNCVTREVDARRYREQSDMSTPPRAYVTVTDTYVPAPAPTPYVEPVAARTGTPVYRDEFGFRYDAYGNRVDRNGNIISPQSTSR